MRSPARTPLRQHVGRGRRRPTAKPTRSNSPGSSKPGCSDISPPSSAHRAGAAAFGDTGDELVDLLGHERADRDVVEEEQRLGALGGDVVDRHRDAVDADRVAAVRRAGRSPTSCRRRRSTTRAAGRRYCFQSTANSPPKPPMSPTTSRRNVDRTCSLMSSTAFSPAAMSTPASAYVSVRSSAPLTSRSVAARRASRAIAACRDVQRGLSTSSASFVS